MRVYLDLEYREAVALRDTLTQPNIVTDAFREDLVAVLDKAIRSEGCQWCGGPLNTELSCQNQCAGNGRD